MEAAARMKFCVYRIWDKNDKLLYIGYTCDLESRIASHKAKTPWIRQAKRYSWEDYDTKLDAQSAEVRAIIEERPRYNMNTKRWIKDRKTLRTRLRKSDWDGGDYYPSPSH